MFVSLFSLILYKLYAGKVHSEDMSEFRGLHATTVNAFAGIDFID
jgi:hypothetical protein